MKVDDLRWYSPYLFLAGAILSFVDPITDMLVLLEFFRADHKMWFGLGIAFIVFPCFAFPLILYSIRENYAEAIICGLNPFSAGLARLQAFVFCLDHNTQPDKDYILENIDFAVLYQAALESAPQFILQLYATSVQEEPVRAVQRISLISSFIIVAWAFTNADERLHEDVITGRLQGRTKVILFVTHLLLLSSRLFAVVYFTVSYKWWIIVVLTLHALIIETVGIIWFQLNCYCDIDKGIIPFFNFCVHWLRDDVAFHDQVRAKRVEKKAMQLLCNLLTVTENFVMILMFYFSQHSNTWYSLPVTVLVCILSLLGAIIRIAHFRFLLRVTQVAPSAPSNDSECNMTQNMFGDSDSHINCLA